MPTKVTIDRRPWAEFRHSGLLWWINRTLHLFGWALVFQWADGVNPETHEPEGVYPARVPYKGFTSEVEDEGFARLGAHIKETFGGK